MKFTHLAVIIALVAVILAAPLKSETWVVLAKPHYEVIGTFELEKGGVLNIDIDTRDLCIKTFEITEAVPIDLVKVITTKASQTVVDGKSVPVMTITIDKAKIEAGFKEQRYKYDLAKNEFELKQALEIVK